MMDSKSFNHDFKAVLITQELRTFIGYANLVTFLGDRAEKTFNRLASFKGEKLVCKPFHGTTVIFYIRN